MILYETGREHLPNNSHTFKMRLKINHFDVGYDRLYRAAVLVLFRFAAFHHSVWRTDIVSTDGKIFLRRKVNTALSTLITAALLPPASACCTNRASAAH